MSRVRISSPAPFFAIVMRTIAFLFAVRVPGGPFLRTMAQPPRWGASPASSCWRRFTDTPALYCLNSFDEKVDVVLKRKMPINRAFCCFLNGFGFNQICLNDLRGGRLLLRRVAPASSCWRLVPSSAGLEFSCRSRSGGAFISRFESTRTVSFLGRLLLVEHPCGT